MIYYIKKNSKKKAAEANAWIADLAWTKLKRRQI